MHPVSQETSACKTVSGAFVNSHELESSEEDRASLAGQEQVAMCAKTQKHTVLSPCPAPPLSSETKAPFFGARIKMSLFCRILKH